MLYFYLFICRGTIVLKPKWKGDLVTVSQRKNLFLGHPVSRIGAVGFRIVSYSNSFVSPSTKHNEWCFGKCSTTLSEFESKLRLNWPDWLFGVRNFCVYYEYVSFFFEEGVFFDFVKPVSF